MERRYQGEYENRLDPFQSFSQSERKRKYGQLSVAEKVIIETELYNLENVHLFLPLRFLRCEIVPILFKL